MKSYSDSLIRGVLVACATTLMLTLSTTGSAQTMFVESDRVSIGATPPTAPLDITATPSTIGLGNAVIKLRNDGGLAFQLDDTGHVGFWNFSVAASENEFRISKSGTGVAELILDASGNLTINGVCSEVGNPGSCADYVFESDYELRPLDQLEDFIAENKHLPNVPSGDEIKRNGVNVQHFQGRLLEKIEELTLYTLQQQKTIDELKEQVTKLSKLVDPTQ